MTPETQSELHHVICCEKTRMTRLGTGSVRLQGPSPGNDRLSQPRWLLGERQYSYIHTCLFTTQQKVTRLPFRRKHTTRKQDTHAFCFYDLELDPMTLVCETDLDILKTYLHTKNEVSRLRLSKVIARTLDRHANRRDRTYYHAALASGT